MSKAKIKIYPKQEGDKKSAELMQKIIDKQYEKYEGVINAITVARTVLLELCPQTAYAGDGIWDRILEEVVQMDIKDLTQKE